MPVLDPFSKVYIWHKKKVTLKKIFIKRLYKLGQNGASLHISF